MVAVNSLELLELLRKHTQEADWDFLREAVAVLAQAVMEADFSAQIGAEPGERSPTRRTYRNGHRPRRWDTRAGTIGLRIPKPRTGSYFPGFLEPRRRAERALLSVVCQAYVEGVSTRKVEDLVQALGCEGISKSQVSRICSELDQVVTEFLTRPLEGAYPYLWLDAQTQKVREGGRVVAVATVIAIGVAADGHREVLGAEVGTSEDGALWLRFLKDLQARGLTGVQLAISDHHEGLREAIGATLSGTSWQRCRTHYLRNLLTFVPKSAQPFVATAVRTIFAQPSAEEVWAQQRRVVEQLGERFSAAAAHLEEAGPDLLAFTAFPHEHWRQIWSNNPLERLNREIRRRTDVVGIFPNRPAIVRLVGSVLAECHDEWQVTRRYMSEESLRKAMVRVIEGRPTSERRWKDRPYRRPSKVSAERERGGSYTMSGGLAALATPDCLG